MSYTQTPIGITERGDAGIDFSWREKMKSTGNRAILITKNLSDQFCKAVLEEIRNGAKIMVHATITGLGGTEIEPNVPSFKTNLKNLLALMQNGVPAENLVLRIDPIIPSLEESACAVLNEALKMGILPAVTVKVSVIDMYRHARERFEKHGISIPVTGFKASPEQFQTIDEILGHYAKTYSVRFTSCSEPDLKNAVPAGCVDKTVCDIFGITPPDMGVNPQNRGSCLCLSGVKTELLTNRKRCPHQCLYCYWKG